MRTILLLISLTLPFAAQAQFAPETRWSDPNQVSLNVVYRGGGYHAACGLRI